MSDHPENPPAFPCETDGNPNGFQSGDRLWTYPGMTLRDYFAANLSFDPECLGAPQAEALMGEKMPSFTLENAAERLAWWLTAEAKYRYARADAMLRERGK